MTTPTIFHLFIEDETINNKGEKDLYSTDYYKLQDWWFEYVFFHAVERKIDRIKVDIDRVKVHDEEACQTSKRQMRECLENVLFEDKTVVIYFHRDGMIHSSAHFSVIPKDEIL